MDIKTLYIIGNGFDLYHGLDTWYKTFAYYLQENDSEVYELFVQYYRLPDLDPMEPDSERIKKEKLWSDFESSLANLDFESVLDDNTNYLANLSSPNFRDSDWHSYQIQMEGIVNKLTGQLCETFKEFILAVEYPDDVDDRLLNFQSHSVFLNFNYTATLERYYHKKRDRVLFIHGEASNPDDEIILGHGRNPSAFIQPEVKPSEDLTEEQLELWRERKSEEYDYSYESGKEELMSYFSKSFKYTEEIIQKNEAFFNSLVEVENVFVLGHSLSEVDQPYFKKVIQSVDDKHAFWTVTYFSNYEYDKHRKTLNKLGLSDAQINLVKIESLRPIHPTLF